MLLEKRRTSLFKTKWIKINQFEMNILIFEIVKQRENPDR
jgi:hypothetical protein